MEQTPNKKTTLLTERLTLRPFSLDDLDAMHTWASDPQNVRYMSWGPNTKEESEAFIQNMTREGYDFVVVLTQTGQVIGSCGIYPNDTMDTGMLGWILQKNHWKKGYGTELAKELIRYGFEDLRLRRIYANCVAENYGSYRVMERCGMRQEALHKQNFWARVDKKWVDERVYAILRDEYFRK